MWQGVWESDRLSATASHFFRPLVLLMPPSLFAPLQSHFEAFVTALRLVFFCHLYIINVLSLRPWLTSSERARSSYRTRFVPQNKRIELQPLLYGCPLSLGFIVLKTVLLFSRIGLAIFANDNPISLTQETNMTHTHTLPYNASYLMYYESTVRLHCYEVNFRPFIHPSIYTSLHPSNHPSIYPCFHAIPWLSEMTKAMCLSSQGIL